VKLEGCSGGSDFLNVRFFLFSLVILRVLMILKSSSSFAASELKTKRGGGRGNLLCLCLCLSVSLSHENLATVSGEFLQTLTDCLCVTFCICMLSKLIPWRNWVLRSHTQGQALLPSGGFFFFFFLASCTFSLKQNFTGFAWCALSPSLSLPLSVSLLTTS
jgi:hypothetical protein